MGRNKEKNNEKSVCFVLELMSLMIWMDFFYRLAGEKSHLASQIREVHNAT